MGENSRGGGSRENKVENNSIFQHCQNYRGNITKLVFGKVKIRLKA
jgi:hypothetical protein